MKIEKLLERVTEEPPKEPNKKFPEWPDDEKWNREGPFEEGVTCRIKHMGTRVFMPDGKEIPYVRDIEIIHRVGEPPMLRIEVYPHRITFEGKAQIVCMCPSCGERQVKRDGDGHLTAVTNDSSTHSSEYVEFVFARDKA